MFHYICKILPIKSRNKTFMLMWNKAEKISHPLTCIYFDRKEAFSRQAEILNSTSVTCAFDFDCLTVKPLSKILFFLNLRNNTEQNQFICLEEDRQQLQKNIYWWFFSYLLLSMPWKQKTVSTILFGVLYFCCWWIHVLIPWCFGKLSSMSWENFKNEAFI